MGSMQESPDRRRVALRCGCLRSIEFVNRLASFRASVRLVAVVVLTVTLAGCHPSARHPQPSRDSIRSIRAIWVTRWDYKSPFDIARVMDNCRAAGFNTVLFQVRGNGTALYRSKIEPWAKEFGGRDPGFDPLAVACKEAHRRGLSLHAWVNVMPGWRGKKPPTDRRQLYHAHADWFWRDSHGRRQPLGWYNSLNPCYPEVRNYLVAVMREIVGNYPVDGLHLDYIRFPNEWHESYGPGRQVPDYPRDPRTLAMFKRATGYAPESAPQAWIKWRTEQVTQLLRDIRGMTRQVKPGLLLSAAVGASIEDAKRRHLQDTRRWVGERLLDVVFPMNYTANPQTFDRRLKAWSGQQGRVPVVTGLMFDGRSGESVIGQLRQALRSNPHFAAFAYNSLFEKLDRGHQPIRDRHSAARAELRRQVISYIKGLSSDRG